MILNLVWNATASAQWCTQILFLEGQTFYPTAAGKGVRVAMAIFHSSGGGK